MTANSSLSRRALLKIVAGSAGAAVSLRDLRGTGTAPEVCASLKAGVIGVETGSASAVAESPAFSPKFFSSQQVQTLSAISDLIIPDEHSPGARAARVHEYMDTVVGGSDSKTKQLWTNGLAALDAAANVEHSKIFVECTPAEQVALLERVCKNEDHPETIEEKFFVAVKRATITGYYTSEIGIHEELEYQGNAALLDFPGCQHPGHRT